MPRLGRGPPQQRRYFAISTGRRMPCGLWPSQTSGYGAISASVAIVTFDLLCCLCLPVDLPAGEGAPALHRCGGAWHPRPTAEHLTGQEPQDNRHPAASLLSTVTTAAISYAVDFPPLNSRPGSGPWGSRPCSPCGSRGGHRQACPQRRDGQLVRTRPGHPR